MKSLVSRVKTLEEKKATTAKYRPTSDSPIPGPIPQPRSPDISDAMGRIIRGEIDSVDIPIHYIDVARAIRGDFAGDE